MNFQNDLLSLIADIDSIFPQTDSLNSEEQTIVIEQQRLVLAKVRSYLVNFQQNSDIPIQTAPVDKFIDQEAAKQIAQAVINQINIRRPEWVNPIQTELEALGEQRQSLLREIRQLEGQRQEIITNFLQVLMSQCNDSLNQQISQTLENFRNQLLYSQSSQEMSEKSPDSFEDYSWRQEPQNLDNLQQLQQQSDQLLINLDSTFRRVFATLEQDLQAYQTSLYQGLERMHSLGAQGEIKLAAYVNYLTEKLEQSTPLKTSQEQNVQQTIETSSSTIKLLPGTQTHPSSPDLPSEQLFPFAGVEIPSSAQTINSSSLSESSSEDEIKLIEEPEIDRLMDIDLDLEEINNAETTIEANELPEQGDEDSNLFNSTADREISQQLDSFLSSEEQEFSATEPVENFLFGGFIDPAMDHKQLPLTGIVNNQETFSVEEALFEDVISTSNTSQEAELVEEKIVDSSINDLSSSPTPEDIPEPGETIELLTDLLEEGALDSQKSNLGEEEKLESAEEEYNLQKNYIPTSPEENLLPRNELDVTKERDWESLLAPNKLEQLSEDLDHFEKGIVEDVNTSSIKENSTTSGQSSLD